MSGQHSYYQREFGIVGHDRMARFADGVEGEIVAAARMNNPDFAFG